MGTRTIDLDEDVYERLSALKRDGETYSEAVERLLDGPSLLELEGILSDDEADEIRAVLDETDREDAEATDELLREFE
jgi:predicted CopG family antitoxin